MKRKTLIRRIQKDFQCQRCNLCCQVPGLVYVSGRDMQRLAKFFNITLSEFKDQYTTVDENHYVLDSPHDAPCRFLTPDGCSVNPAKPSQCSSFPKKWRDKDAFDYCEGIELLKNASD